MSLSRTYFELASRYQSSDYNTETVYTGEYSADKMITIEVDSKRPYFNAPPTNGHFGNPITFINLVKVRGVKSYHSPIKGLQIHHYLIPLISL